MNSLCARSAPPFSVFSSSGRFGVDEDRSESYKLVDSGYTPFYSEYYDDYGAEEYFHRPRKADNYYGIRQEYLRSYTFTREEPKPDTMKDSVKRFKAVVWAVLCFRKFKYSQAKMLREKLSSRSSRFIHESTGYISASCRKIAVPSCIRLSSLEVA
ncbi:unnamed protein product [Calypogeia fissa]